MGKVYNSDETGKIPVCMELTFWKGESIIEKKTTTKEQDHFKTPENWDKEQSEGNCSLETERNPLSECSI